MEDVGRFDLQLDDLFGRVTELLEGARQLALVARALLGAGHSLHQTRGSADKQLDIARRRLGQHLLQQVLGDVALGATGPLVGGRLLQDVKDAELLRVRVLELVQLLAQQNVLLGDVAKHQRHLGLIDARVLEDGLQQLVHGRDAGTARQQSNVLVLVGCPWVLGDGTLDLQLLARHQRVDVRRHRPALVLLDEQIQVADRVVVTDRSIRPYHRLLCTLWLEFGQQRRCCVHPRHAVLLRQLEPELLRVVVERLDALQLQAQESLAAAPHGFGLPVSAALPTEAYGMRCAQTWRLYLQIKT
ncbi:hypothetical protein CMQ_5627 [Grosmannia clavigera kw1407]|uniref:Uncharacterized protein n=1 Tax=Grosmannia clavigera (strain kw1407 / UAMH 11150) TaxID=655863 RepID=F0XT26_GROCL|nr:uncharacterized protein CMQ_5627 [Grosmannia clavigera kw1407]EFW99206.1 hypothetical protein CMQ_5627 [Grosmannia clavigera kw1407]